MSADIEAANFEKELRKFIIPKLRQMSKRWPYRNKAIQAARVSRGRYRCAMCGREDLRNGDYDLDHVQPFIPVEGWDGNLDTVIRRLLVKDTGWQLLCKEPCHRIKTDTENHIRKMHRDKKKERN